VVFFLGGSGCCLESSLVFSLFINDISVNLRYCRLHLFADDCQIYFSFRPGDVVVEVRSINGDLVAVHGLCVGLFLGFCLNVAKTQILLCITPQNTSIVRRTMTELSLCLTLNTADLAVLDVVINLDVDLGKDQVNRVVKQVFLKLMQLHYFLYLLSPSIKIKLVKSLVLPILDYADSVFCEIGVGLEMKLNKALNNCIRFIYSLDRSSEISGYRYRLRFFRSSARRRLNLSLLVF
jgi:hypothetical protein